MYLSPFQAIVLLFFADKISSVKLARNVSTKYIKYDVFYCLIRELIILEEF